MAIKTYPHAVIYDGIYYPANTEIKVKEEKPTETVVKKNDKGTSRKA